MELVSFPIFGQFYLLNKRKLHMAFSCALLVTFRTADGYL